MKFAHRILASLAVPALMAGCASLPIGTNRGDALALASAESAFAASGARDGVKASFLGAMSDDATLFRPGPVNGRAYVAGRNDPPIMLDWRPQRVMVAASGELGYSSGPSRITPKSAPAGATSTSSYGQFVTVWRKNTEGRWQVLVDHGIYLTKPWGWDLALDPVTADFGPRPDEPIAATEARFSAVSEREGIAEAYRAFGSRYLRVLRDGQAPVDGAANVDVVAAMPASAGRWSWSSTDTGTAISYDLGWSMGRYRVRDTAGTTRVGYYLRIWRAEGGAWKVVSDVLAPIEEPAK